jgi:hypothetical protein
MIELIVERWTDATASTYRWSLWVDGERSEMGGPHKTAEGSERDGRAFCRERFGREPDRVSRL